MFSSLNTNEQSFTSIPIPSDDKFQDKLVLWANRYDTFCYLTSNNCTDSYGKYDFLIGIDILKSSAKPIEVNYSIFQFGYYSYEHRFQFYQLTSQNDSFIDFDTSFFFLPRIIIYQKENRLFINRNCIEAMQLIDLILSERVQSYSIPKVNFEEKTSETEYLENIHIIKERIKEGNFYELNYCVDFQVQDILLEPHYVFLEINRQAANPMSSLFKLREKWILSFSPERLAALRGDRLICQPMKGTTRRNLNNETADSMLKSNLEKSEKDLAENMMIVDLMRNDMTPMALPGSIQVVELCKVYSFPFVHQMISTIEARLEPNANKFEALEHLLPAGSMTGAPKKEVMKNIEEIENFKRNLYAGNIGYIDSEGDFDFNVVIRSLYYDSSLCRLSLSVGGAVTLLSEPEKEYDECMAKSEGILHFFR